LQNRWKALNKRRNFALNPAAQVGEETKTSQINVIVLLNESDTFMKRTRQASLLVMLLLGLVWNAGAGDRNPKAGGEEGIKFTESSWKALLKKAKAENKVIFLDAYTSWCGPCKMLQKNVFTQKSVGDYFNKEFINVKMDMEKGEGITLSQIYPLEGYPTLLFIDGNGRVVKKILGYQNPQQLLAAGKSVKAPTL
jgi:thioredoxin 1